MEGTSEDPHVALRDVWMAYGDRPVLKGLSCEFPRGKISVILGGSGSGKSTLLKVLAGLVTPQSGEVLVEGQDLTTLSDRGLRSIRERIGMMFQGGALLDSMTVFENLALPLREHTRRSNVEIAEAVRGVLEAVDVHQAEILLPGQLSGGMVKRVALGRAIIGQPAILLSDEPVSGLDPVSTKRIEALFREINERDGMTMIVVSHHIPSTMRMADLVLALLPDGPVSGTPAELQASSDPRIVNFLNEDADDPLGAEDVEMLPGQSLPGAP